MNDNFDIGALRSDSTEEFRKIYHYYGPRLNGFFSSRGASNELNADVIQQTFIKLWERRRRLNPEVKLSTQIFQIAKTTMIDEIRKEQAILRKKQSIYKYRSVQNHNIYLLEEKEMYYQLNKAIDLLPPIRKAVFLLSRDNNMSHKEISDKLSISVKTVNKHIQLAIKQIKPYMHI